MPLNLVSLLSAGRSGMYFSKVPWFPVATKRTNDPFELTLFTTNTGSQSIDLYAQFSNARPYQDPQNKYGHLLAQWEFLDSNLEITSNIQPTMQPVYGIDGTMYGLTGTAEFYYKDDMPSTQLGYPVLIWATLDTSNWPIEQDNEIFDAAGYSNSKIISVIPCYVLPLYPEHLEITRNGRDNIIPLRWQDVEFPYFITIHSDDDLNCVGGNEPIIFDYPQNNFVGSRNEVNRSLLLELTATSAVEWDPEHQYFQRTDADGFHVGGFVRGSVTPHISANVANISATVNIEMTTYPHFSFPAWVSNPENNNIYRIIHWGELAQTVIDEITSVPLPDPLIGFGNKSPTPYIQEIDLNNTWGLTGFGGIWGIAVEPPCLAAWCTDYEMDKIYKFNTQGELISTIDLATKGLSGYSPAGIYLDGNKNLWVTIFDAPSVLKIDNLGNHLLTVTNPEIDVLPAAQDYAYKPGPVETDTENNVWVGYSNSLSSSLVKYNTSGIQTASAIITISATPFDIVLDWDDNSIWVTQVHSNLDLLGKVEKFNSTGGVPICSFEFPQPAYVTLDDNKTVWFTYGYQKMGYITTTGLTGSFVVSADNVSPLVPPFFDEDDFVQDHALGGITMNGNNVWVIQSVENKVYVISADPTTNPDQMSWGYFKIVPDQNISYAWDSEHNHYSYEDQYQKSAQAYGDWTGLEWIKKYSSYYPENSAISYEISGISNDFYILPFDNRYDIRRFNESWDAAKQIRAYALPEHINANYNLWENYMGNMWGGLSADAIAIGNEAADRQSFGRLSYEKIANFVKNHSDIEVANVDQLYSIAQQLDVPIDDYNFNFPVLVNRIMDIVSVPHDKLWGARCKCAKNFSMSQYAICKNCNHEHTTNLGEVFLPFSYVLSADVPFVVKPKFISTEYSLLTPIVNAPLSAVQSVSWLLSADYSAYDFFNYIPGYCNTQVEGIINWADQYTTLSENNSSLSAWYNEYGIIEEMISYYIHKGLRLNN